MDRDRIAGLLLIPLLLLAAFLVYDEYQDRAKPVQVKVDEPAGYGFE